MKDRIKRKTGQGTILTPNHRLPFKSDKSGIDYYVRES
jgi:hypothetical protein